MKKWWAGDEGGRERFVIAVCNCGGRAAKDSYSIMHSVQNNSMSISRDSNIRLQVKTSSLSKDIPSQGLFRIGDQISTEQAMPTSLWQTGSGR